jgi:hypothetical protein
MQKMLDPQQRQQSPGIVEEAENFAYDVYKAASRYGSASSKGSRYWICKPKDGSGECEEYYVLQHHAELEKTVRQKIENVLSSNDNWNLVIATSTLELGVNIPGVAVVLQYGAPPSGESFVQRVGRSGRDEWSFRTAFGAVFARNVGRDVMLIDEMEAIRDLYNLTRPGYSPKLDRETLARYTALIYFDRAIINTINAKGSIDDPLVQALFQALLKLYLDDDNEINETLDNIKKIVENRERYERIFLSEDINNKPRGIIPATSLFNVIVENLMAIPERLEDVKDYLEEIGLGQEYAKEEIKEIEELRKRVRHWRRYIEQPSASRGRLSISKYLHEYATNVYDVLYSVNENFRKITNKIIEINKSNDLKELLETAKSVIEGAEQAILSTIIASDEICLSSGLHSDRHMTSYDDIMALLLGMPMPHPVSYSEPGSGCLLVSDEVEISSSKIKLKGKVLRNVNRDYVLRNVPFTHYEVS